MSLQKNCSGATYLPPVVCQDPMGGPKLANVGLTTYNRDVYEPSEDSFALVDAVAATLPAITNPAPALCVEVGGGSGYVICSLALMLAEAGHTPHCLVTDLSSNATAACQQTLLSHAVQNVDVVRMDLLSSLLPRLKGTVDILLFNPPYVPTPQEEVPTSQAAYDAAGCQVNAAWAGGDRGRQVVDRLLPLVPDILSPSGHFFLVTVLENDPQEILGTLEAQGLHGRIALKQSADEECLQILHFSRSRFS